MSFKSYVVNEKLRTATELTTEEKEFTKQLDTALDKMPSYEGNLQRSLEFRSADEVSNFLKDYTIDKEITYKEYISTTKGEIYNPEAQVQIYIANAKNGKDISSINEAEKEVLYARGSSFTVKKIFESGGTYYILMEEKNE